MINLPNVTLICVTNRDFEGHKKSIEKTCKGIQFGAVKIIYDYSITDLEKYSKAVLYNLCDYVKTDFALLVQADSWVINPNEWTDEFFNYDYIGAPWPSNLHFSKDGTNIRVGNGGFSLRSKKMLNAFNELKLKFTDSGTGFTHEDGQICVYYKEELEKHGIKMAPVEIAAKFSTELLVSESVKSFGFHKYLYGDLFISKDDVINTSVDFLKKYYKNIGHISTASFVGKPQYEHYKLLTYLSSQFDNALILDVGTCDGISALCLAQNSKNKVVSYDIEKKDINSIINEGYQHTPLGGDYPNIEFRNMDINNENKDFIKSADFIFLDISHNGFDEKKFSDMLTEIKFNGILLCDDIETTIFPLREWFYLLPYKKYYLTEIGHSTGSGLVDFGNHNITIF